MAGFDQRPPIRDSDIRVIACFASRNIDRQNAGAEFLPAAGENFNALLALEGSSCLRLAL